MKVTFAQMGNYTLAIKDLIKGIGCDFVAPDQTNNETVREGVRLAPETICFPCKVNLGNYLSAIRNGADTIIMFDSQGQCRFRYYGMLQRKILKDYGHKVSFVVLSARNFLSQLDKLNKISPWRKMRLIRYIWKKIKLIEGLEEMARYCRPRELNSGQTDIIFKECLADIDQVANNWQLEECKSKLRAKFQHLPLDENKEVLKVGMIGEIFTVIDSFTNQQIEAALGKMGVEIHRDLTLTTFIKHSLNPFHERNAQKTAKGYLDYIVGGHGLESVVEMLNYAKNGYDGVVHIWPFGCMPEITVRPILDKIKQKHDIALLGISIDEQSASAGLQTRLEAFVDLLKSKKAHKQI